MTDKLEITQEDREAAAGNILARLIHMYGGEQPWMDASTQSMRMGEQDDHREVKAFARHRLQERERCAKVAGFCDYGDEAATAIRQPKEPSNG